MNEAEKAIQDVIGETSAEPHAGRVCGPEAKCKICDGIRTLQRCARAEGFRAAKEKAARIASETSGGPQAVVAAIRAMQDDGGGRITTAESMPEDALDYFRESES
jgi:hypothetical protein